MRKIIIQAMFVHPGTYEKIVFERPDGSRNDTPWCRADNQRFLNGLVEDRLDCGGRVLYRLRVTIPPGVRL